MRVTVKGIDDVMEFIDHWRENREELGYDIDGIVIKVDDLRAQRTAGYHRQEPALGDRLQVSRGGRCHRTAGH